MFRIRRSLLDYLCRALCCALAAVGALLVIDDCHIILHMNSIELTLFGTQRTSDTASGADFLDSRSLVVGRALYKMLCLVRNKLDQVATHLPQATHFSLSTTATPSTTWIASN